MHKEVLTMHAPDSTNSTSRPAPSNMRGLGIAVTLLGLLLTCCLCPLAVNSLVFIATSAGSPSGLVSLYGRWFPTKMGSINLAAYISGAQLILSTILALLVLIMGIVILVRIRRTSTERK